MTIILKFLGALRHDSGKDVLTLGIEKGTSVLNLVRTVTQHAPTLRHNLLDEMLEPPKPNAIILLNGREISVLKGLETRVKDGDEVVFVPVVHGG